MRVLHSWLQRLVAFDLSPVDLPEALGMLGLEVEKVEHLGAVFDGFFIGTVLGTRKHPNADRLTVCEVGVGKEPLTIVCGAPNVKKGLKVVVGLAGAVVPRNQHDPNGKPFEIRRTVIRGVESEGMLCSEFELGLGPDADGILILKNRGLRNGVPFSRVLGLNDVAYDIEVTPNRPDWLGHMGVAREIGIATRKKPRIPPIHLKESRLSAHKVVKIRIHDKEGCRRFAVRVVKGVTIAPSPGWMQRDLKALGIRPVNNVVDVTNWVMMETGQPMHAFDLATLVGGEIHIRRSATEQQFDTLDGRTVAVPEGALLVFDKQRSVSIAGIMGGKDSAISTGTTDIVLEAACWNASSIRRTARMTGLSTDASYRFERGSDPDAIPYALDRASQLVLETAGGEILRGRVDLHPGRARRLRIRLRNERVNRILGTDLSLSQTGALLKRLDIPVKKLSGTVLTCEIPGFRSDLGREIDLVEEIARAYGYDNIPEKKESIVPMRQEPAQARADLRETVVGLGFRECVAIPLVDINLAAKGASKPVSVLNPISVEMNALRSSLVPGLLGVVSRNIRHGSPDLRLFEIGRIFSRDDANKPGPVKGFAEEERIALCLSGLSTPHHWSTSPRQVDIFDMKGEVTTLLQRLSLDKSRFISYRTSDSLVEHAVGVEINGGSAGYLGTVRAELLNSFGIEQDVIVGELRLESLYSRHLPRFKALPRYPRVRRDVAFVVDQHTPAGHVEEVILSASSGLLVSVELFDLYEGDQLPPGKKSLAFSLVIVPRERTLTDSEIDQEVGGAVRAVANAFGAELRRMPGSGQ